MPAWLAPWEWTSADWAGLQFVVLVVAAIVAWRQVHEARRVREERARPFVVVDLDVFQTLAEFRITNLGSTIARNVRFSFDPPLRSSRDGEAGVAPLAEVNLFKAGIPSLPPGKEVVALFDHLPARMESGLPDDYAVTVSYDTPSGKRLTETMTVGYGYLREVGRHHRRDIHDVHRELERIYREMRKWTVLGSAVKVMTPADVDAYVTERKEELERRRALAAGEQAARDEVEQLGPSGMTTTSPDEQRPHVFPAPSGEWGDASKRFWRSFLPVTNGGPGVALNVTAQLRWGPPSGVLGETVPTSLAPGEARELPIRGQPPDDWGEQVRGLLHYGDTPGRTWETAFRIHKEGGRYLVEVQGTRMIKRADGSVVEPGTG